MKVKLKCFLQTFYQLDLQTSHNYPVTTTGSWSPSNQKLVSFMCGLGLVGGPEAGLVGGPEAGLVGGPEAGLSGL